MRKRSNTKRYSKEFRLKAVKLKLEKGYSLKATALAIYRPRWCSHHRRNYMYGSFTAFRMTELRAKVQDDKIEKVPTLCTACTASCGSSAGQAPSTKKIKADELPEIIFAVQENNSSRFPSGLKHIFLCLFCSDNFRAAIFIGRLLEANKYIHSVFISPAL